MRTKLVIKKCGFPDRCKYEAIFMGAQNMRIKFGDSRYSDFTQTHDLNQRRLYILRHQKNESWDTPFSAGSLSRHLLWGDFWDFDRNLRAFKNKFDLD